MAVSENRTKNTKQSILQIVKLCAVLLVFTISFFSLPVNKAEAAVCGTLTWTTNGTQTATVTGAATTQYMGAFKATCAGTTSSTAVTSIGVTLSGTNLAASEIANLKIWTDTATSCATTSGFTTQPTGGTIASPVVGKNTFSISGTNASVSGSTGFRCFYVTVDTTTSAVDAHTLEVSIAATTDVAPTAAGTFPLAVTGTTTFADKKTITGTVYSDEGTTAVACQTTTKLAIGSTLWGSVASCAGNVYTFSNVTGVIPGTILTVFNDTATSADRFAIVTRADNNTSSLTLNAYKGRVILRSEDASSITNANLGSYCGSGCTTSNANVQFSNSAGAITITSGTKLLVFTGDTYAPGNNITTDSIEVMGTYSGVNESLTLNGVGTSTTCTAAAGTVAPFCVNGGTFTAGSGTVVVGGAGTITFPAAAATFNNVTINNATAAVTLGGNTTINGTLTLTAGSLQLGTSNISVTGATSITGTIDDNSTTGTNSFSTITVNSGGTWTSTGNAAYSISSSLTVNTVSTFTSGSGAYTFTGTSASIGGTQAFTITNLTNNVTTSGLTFATNNPTVTTLTQGTNAVLTFSGTAPTITSVAGSASGNTVNFTSSGAQTIPGGTYNNLTINKSAGVASLGGNVTINGALTVTAGTLQLATSNISVTGATSITGTIDDSSATGTNTFGAITVNSGGTWTSTGNAAYSIGGNLTVNSTSTFTSGSGAYTFTGTSASIGGTQAFTITNLTNNVTTSGLTFATNNPTVTTLTQGTNAVLTFSGTAPTVTTMAASATGNSVTFTGSGAQTIPAGTYYDLIVNNSAATASLGGTVSVNDNLTITAGTLQLGTASITVTNTTSVTGTIDDNSATGTNTFGAITVNSGGTWTSTGNAAYAIGGNLTVNTISTFTSGSGMYTFSGTSVALGGTQAFTITNATNNVTGSGLTIAASNPTITSLTQGTNALLVFSGTVPTITTLTATASGNTVTYSSTAAQTIIPITYVNLTINKTAGTATVGGVGLVATLLTLTAGTLDLGNNSISTAQFSTANSNTRSITMGSGTWTLSGTGTVWDASTSTGLTITQGTSTIKVTDSSATGKIFKGGGLTYNNFWFAPGTGTGALTIAGSNTFNDFKDDGTIAHSLLFTAGTTTTVTTFTVSGNSGQLIVINSGDGAGGTSTATHTLTKAGGGTISVSYLDIQHSVATPVSTWSATNSTDHQSVTTAGSGWTITAPSSDGTAYTGGPYTIPGTVEAENFNNGGEGVAYHDTDTANQGGQYRPSEGVDIETTGDTGGGYDVGWVNAGEWMKYMVNVQSTGSYSFSARVAGFSAGSINLEMDGTVVATLATVSTGSYATWQTVTATGISLTAGAHVMRVYNTNTTDNFNWFSFAGSNNPPTANAGLNQSITLPTTTTTLSGSGSDTDGTIASYAWTFVSGPVTPSITTPSSATTGVTGLTTAGTYTFRLTVTDNLGATGSSTMNVVVNPDPNTKLYYVDFGLSTNQTSTTGWNNLSDMTTTGPTLTLVDSTGATSARTLHITDSFYYNSGLAMDSSVNQNGTTSSTLFPASATGDSFFLGTLNAITDTSSQITLGSLNNAYTYDFTFYASRVNNDGANRTTDYTIGATTVTLNATDNVNTTASITGVSPSSGSIVINIAKDAAATFGYLGVLQVTEHIPANNPPTANAGTNQSVTMPISSVTLTGSGTDTDGTIASYAWTETTSNYATIVSPTSATTTVKDLAAGTYTFQLTVTDNQGATGTSSVNVVVANQPLVTPTAQTVVVLGSSTSAGYGITPSSDAYVNRFATYFDGLVAGNNVVNLAVSGYTTYQILPTGSSTVNRPAPDTAHNITQALTYNPAAILVNMPSNDTANGYSTAEQETNFQTLASTAASAGVPIWFTTTQPRDSFTQAQVDEQTAVRDWINTTYGTKAIDFWTTFATASGTIDPTYDQGDGIHLNNIGHKKLYARVAESTMISVVHDNAPTANPGTNQSITTSTATLTGSGSDTDGTVASYAWTFVSGPATPTIASPSTASTSITGMGTAGTYVFRLTVTDNLGKSGSGTVNVVTTAAAAGCSSQVASGSWNSVGTWDCGRIPNSGDSVTIALGHSITMNVASNALAALTVNGTLNTAGYNLTTGSLTVASSGTLSTGSSTIVLTGTGTAFSNSGAVSAANSTIELTDATSAAKTFAGGGGTYGLVWFAGGAGTGSFTVSGNNTFGEFKDNGSAGHSILFTAGSTQTINTWTVSGTANNLITINSTTTGTHTLVKVGSQAQGDYLNIQHSIATPGNTWYAGTNSVNNQSVTSAGSGWVFQTVQVYSGGGSGVRNAGGETDNGTGTGTCADGIQNGNETGIDTGGRCANTGGGAGGGGTGGAGGETTNGTGTGTCSDGIQNGNETGIDQGGRCANTGGGAGGGGGDSGFNVNARFLALLLGGLPLIGMFGFMRQMK